MERFRPSAWARQQRHRRILLPRPRRTILLLRPQELQHSPGNPAETPATNPLINTLDQIHSRDADPHIRPIPPEQRSIARVQSNCMEESPSPATLSPSANRSSIGDPQPWDRSPSPATQSQPTICASSRHALTRSRSSHRLGPTASTSCSENCPDTVTQRVLGTTVKRRTSTSATTWKSASLAGPSSGASDIPSRSTASKTNVFSFNSTGECSGAAAVSAYGDREDPGDRKSNFDFTYRLPFLRRVVTLYADAYSDDDPSPLAAPRRAVWNPGIYFARLPFLPHMDLRVEAVSSEGLFE